MVQRIEHNTVEKYKNTYRYELDVLGAQQNLDDETKKIAESKLVGIAVLSYFAKPDGSWRVATVGRDDLMEAMALKKQTLRDPKHERDFSRYQFAVALNIETGTRLIIDLGSSFGTGLADGIKIKQAGEFNQISSVGRVALAFAAENLTLDEAHAAVSANIMTSSQKALPEPDVTGVVRLMSTFNNISWYPILKHASQKLLLGEHGEYAFILNRDNSLTYYDGKSREFDGDGKALQLAFSYLSYQQRTTKKPIYSATVFAPKNSPLLAAQQAFESMRRELLADPKTNSNHALKSALEEITTNGLLNMNGYPAGIMCPILHDAMKDPMLDQYGYSFDRANQLEQLIVSPVTGQQYSASHVFKPNAELKRLIDAFRLARPDLTGARTNVNRHSSANR